MANQHAHNIDIRHISKDIFSLAASHQVNCSITSGEYDNMLAYCKLKPNNKSRREKLGHCV